MKIAYCGYVADAVWRIHEGVSLWERPGLGDTIFARQVNGAWEAINRPSVPFVQDLVRRKDLGPYVCGSYGVPTIYPRRLQILEATKEERSTIAKILREYMGYRKRLRRGLPIDMKNAVDSSKERT